MLDEVITLSEHFLRLYNRPYVRYFLKTHNFNHRLCIITGARGVGKSTALVQFLIEQQTHNRAKILYVQADHFSVSQYSLYEIAEAFVNYGGDIICFDEIHKSPEWSITLKSIYDTFPSLKVLASGSSALAINKGTHDLSRRAIVYPLYGMSFREFLELNLNVKLPHYDLEILLKDHGEIAEQIVQQLNKEKVLSWFKEYLYCGYYPYFREFNDIDLFYMTLEQNIHTTIESDLPAIYPTLSGVSISKIKKLLSAIAGFVPFVPNFSELKSLIDISDERTLKTYLQYLVDAGAINLLQKSGKGLTGLEKPEKIYLNNANQLFALRGKNNVEIGTVREVYFANIFSAMPHELRATKKGDFIIDDRWVFEVGGKNKNLKQIKELSNAYLALDDIEIGHNKRIPLWLFGLLY